MKDPIKTINGNPIWLTEDGKFTTSIQGRTVTKASLREIEKLFNKTYTAVIAYNVNGLPEKPYKVEISGFERGRARYKNGQLASRWARFYLLTDVQLDLLNKLAKEHDALENKWSRFLDNFTRLDEDNIEEKRK